MMRATILKITSQRRLTTLAPPANGVILTRIAGVSPISSSSPIWEVSMELDGTK